MLTTFIASVVLSHTGQADQPSIWERGQILTVKSTSTGTFTSYGGEVTPIKLSKTYLVKIVSDVNEGFPFKVAVWESEIKGEPIYVFDGNTPYQPRFMGVFNTAFGFGQPSMSAEEDLSTVFTPGPWLFDSPKDEEMSANNSILNHLNSPFSPSLTEHGTEKVGDQTYRRFEFTDLSHQNSFSGVAQKLNILTSPDASRIFQISADVHRPTTVKNVAGELKKSMSIRVEQK